MDNKTYLSAAERTEKKFPDGLTVPAKLYHELANLFIDFTDTAQRIDEFKKRLIYKEIPIAPGEPTIKLDQRKTEFLHAIMGMVGELGEIADSLGTDLSISNRTHFLEELGDYRWYESVFYRYLETSQEQVQEMNIRKLAARYPEKYTDEAALFRDKAAEFSAMDSIEY